MMAPDTVVPSEEVVALAKEEGIAKRTLESAKKELGIRAKRIAFPLVNKLKDMIRSLYREVLDLRSRLRGQEDFQEYKAKTTEYVMKLSTENDQLKETKEAYENIRSAIGREECERLEKIGRYQRLGLQAAEDGMYYPSIDFTQVTDYSIGKYGIMAAENIMEHDRAKYFRLIREGRWNSYLHEIDMEIGDWVEKTVEWIKEKEGINEHMKAENPVEWVQRVNTIRMMVEDVVLRNCK